MRKKIFCPWCGAYMEIDEGIITCWKCGLCFQGRNINEIT